MIPTHMPAFLMREANTQVKEAVKVDDQAPPLHA